MAISSDLMEESRGADCQKRELGFIETVMAMTHRELRGTTQIAHMIHLHGKVELSQLRDAARLLSDEYTVLRCTIAENDGTFSFVESLTDENLPIRQISITDPEAWRAILDDEADTPLDQTESLWRVTLLSGPDAHDARLIVVGHHTMADWTGLEVMFTRLITNLDKVIAGEKVEFTQQDIPLPVDDYLKPTEKAIPAPATAAKMPYKQWAPLSGRRTRGEEAVLGPEQLARLRERCASEKVKVHSLLSAALCRSAYSLGLVGSPVPVWTPVSLRIFGKLRKKQQSDLSCYISVADTPIDVSSGDIWSIARQYEGDLFRYTKNYCLHRRKKDVTNIAAMVKAIGESRSFVQGFAITNVGDVDLPECRNLSIEDYVTRVNRLAGNFASAVQVDVFKGNLRFTFVYPEPLWDKPTVAELCRSFIDSLENV